MAPSWSLPPQYSRIRLDHTEDFETPYSVLAAYAVDPLLALTVEELTIDTDRWPKEPSYTSSANPVDKRAHGLLEDRIRNVGLGPEGTEDMIAALARKDDAAPRTEARQSRRRREACHRLCHENVTYLYFGEIDGLCLKPLEEILYKSNYGLISQEHRVFQNLESAQRLSPTRSGHDRRIPFIPPYFPTREQLMERRGERLPSLKEVVGVDKEVVGEGSVYEIDLREKGMWTWSRPATGWVEVEQ
ncbi:hypothetical protein CTA1_871 [Colletotrichum tanaceti]|uniref:Uncharacterized protein n=1 Tax=Colletotrichum tanaceti TaxID=1306861 RepID=A0A4U6XTI2_9PEZI|nr:hypothetical protein CTA1_871 [Colletotrichum tanaceti]